jgi:short-subunit dehydrogenase
MSVPVLQDKVALITGASSGIGEGLAKLMAQLGMTVALAARRESELRRVAEEIHEAGGQARTFPANLLNREQVDSLVDRVVEDLGPVDALVHSAGTIDFKPLHELDPTSWDAVFEVNLRAAAILTANVLPGMRQRRRGWIIHVSSEAGIVTYPGMGAYGISKHALCALTELVQVENQEEGIKAWALCPGETATERATKLSTPDQIERFLQVSDILDVARLLLTQDDNVKLGPIIHIATTLNPNA